MVTESQSALTTSTITAPINNPIGASTLITTPTTTTTTSSYKHSMSFYISPATLFNNRRLKQKRLKWAAAQYGYKNKTECQPTLTINLLSDDEETEDGDNYSNTQQESPATIEQEQINLWQQQQDQQFGYPKLKPIVFKTIDKNEPPPLVPLSTKTNNIKSMFVYQQQKQNNHVENVPQLTFIPVNPQAALTTALTTIMNNNNKRRRKKRNAAGASTTNATQILMNEESIVLSDDSDDNATTKDNNINKNHTLLSLSPDIPMLPELTLTAINNSSNNNNNNNNSSKNNYNNSKSNKRMSSSGEEEVTVSLVPRSAVHTRNMQLTELEQQHEQLQQQQQQQQKLNKTKNDVFPMLPDETTVHTVIANRTYELTLSKLREGLAQGEQASPNVKAKKPQVSPQTTPISLKLSSDLSISLISDDEDDNSSSLVLSNDEQARISAELLRRQQPQLSVQEVNIALNNRQSTQN